MSTLYATTSTNIAARLAAQFSALPVIWENDNGDGVNLSSGFVGAEVAFSQNRFASINWPTPRTQLNGIIILDVCSPVNAGALAGLQYADQLHTIFSGKVFNGIHCFVGHVDKASKIEYAKGEFWRTPFMCNFYVREWLDVS